MADLGRYDPFQELDELMRGVVFRPMRTGPPQIQSIKVDATENDGAYLITAEIPGVRKEDIRISVDGAEVTISAETRSEKEEKDGERVIHRERYYGTMSRSFSLPQAVDEGSAQAKYDHGVLTLTLPKRAGSRSKKIAIT